MQSSMFDIIITQDNDSLLVKFYDGTDECPGFYSAIHGLIDTPSLTSKFKGSLIDKQLISLLQESIKERLMSLPVVYQYGYSSYKEVLKHYYDLYNEKTSPVKSMNIVMDLSNDISTMSDLEFRDAVTNLLLGPSYIITEPMDQEQANQVMFNAIVEHYYTNKKKRKPEKITMKPTHPKIKSPNTYVCTANDVDYYVDVECDIVAYRSWKLGYESLSYEGFKRNYTKHNVPYDVFMLVKEHFDKR